jgi:hypothetical protein
VKKVETGELGLRRLARDVAGLELVLPRLEAYVVTTQRPAHGVGRDKVPEGEDAPYQGLVESYDGQSSSKLAGNTHTDR